MGIFILIALLLSLILTLAFLLYKKHKAFLSVHNENRLIFDYVIIMHFDLDGKILAVSDAYTHIFGYEKSLLIGQTIDKSYVSPSNSKAPIWSILEREGFFEGDMQLFTRQGKPYWLHKRIVKDYDINGKHVGYIAISEDITAVKAFEEQQEVLVDQSRHAAMGEMISMIAHQWRQPLATMSSVTTAIHLDIALNKVDKAKLNKQINNINQVIEHLDHTIEDFRNFFKQDKKAESFVVYDMLQEAKKMIDFKLQNIEIDINVDPEQKITLLKNELLQVIINLLSNAADALTETVRPCIDITLNFYEEHECAVLIIGDNGTGIDEKHLPYIFDPYFSTKSKNGTGLGLYICKTIIEKHLHGVMNVRNRKQGCEFLMTLPHETSHCEETT